MSLTHWTTQDRRCIPLTDLEDSHVLSILKMGLKVVKRRENREALEALAAGYAGDGGCQYLADVENETSMMHLADRSWLLSTLKATTRFGPVVAEAERRCLPLGTY